MNSGLYAALSGSINSMKRLDIISNNIANANTPGFKKDRLAFESQLKQASESAVNPPAGGDATPVFSGDRFYTDFSTGTIQQTGNVLDIAIEGDGFFAVTTPNGPAYTRQGNFRMDVSGRLVTADGNALSPEVVIPNNATQITIGSDGTVSAYLPGETTPVTVGTLQVVDFPQPYALQKVGSALFVPADPQVAPEPATNAVISQGALEGANVSTISEMVMLIENSRYFEACTKVVKSFDDMTAKAANDLGKV
ncbi:flagellar basal-body rod protein FlgF [Geobacter pelophilus]|jgi:flagellar basal-body rod protein FlgG|uniref:Flagellar basal-body rod protein FlgF n=1 Tax=Geoanaerobacter pelophilus TaxID=60036 RepID=A0AAW4L373_9BACT|nr:flagellar basal-body rod protein FlgF [Geoanaerobacter pelophilus]MBT0663950.1 flagellar basal-body rod protein FlgF [Geoanaerobacter pelophilus]